MATPLIQIDSLVKQYTRDTQVLTVLDKLSLSVEDGDFVALMGPSGSGKTTLLNLIAGIDRPTSGRILVGDAEVSKMSEAALAKWRSANVGFIFQLYNLVPVLTAYENVELPLLLTKLNRARRRKQVELALSVVGLGDRMDHYPRQLSGGQEQRVAIARAIATDPKLLVADEPTGDLDSKNGEEILILMERLNAEFRKTIVMVTHDPKAASRAHRLVHLDKGVLKEDVHAEKGKAVGMAAAISASAT
ncbi:MAG: ABC transporter ATP-binding protein [Acidobacteriota bacterium]